MEKFLASLYSRIEKGEYSLRDQFIDELGLDNKALLAFARYLREKRFFVLSAEIIEKVLKDDPLNKEAAFLLVDIFVSRNMVKAAKRALNRCKFIDPLDEKVSYYNDLLNNLEGDIFRLDIVPRRDFSFLTPGVSCFDSEPFSGVVHEPSSVVEDLFVLLGEGKVLLGGAKVEEYEDKEGVVSEVDKQVEEESVGKESTQPIDFEEVEKADVHGLQQDEYSIEDIGEDIVIQEIEEDSSLNKRDVIARKIEFLKRYLETLKINASRYGKG